MSHYGSSDFFNKKNFFRCRELGCYILIYGDTIHIKNDFISTQPPVCLRFRAYALAFWHIPWMYWAFSQVLSHVYILADVLHWLACCSCTCLRSVICAVPCYVPCPAAAWSWLCAWSCGIGLRQRGVTPVAYSIFANSPRGGFDNISESKMNIKL